MARKLCMALALIFALVAGTSGLHPALSSPLQTELKRSNQSQLLTAARAQIGVTVLYDPTYSRMSFPNGDVDRKRGVCTDVVIRAYRDALGYDLQEQVNRDMKANFSSYPKNWGLKRPDANIDHRRVPNLQVFLSRKGKSLPISKSAADYQAGDIVTQMLPGNLPHIVLVSNKLARDGATPLVIHNIGRGTQEEDSLFNFPITGHYRFMPEKR